MVIPFHFPEAGSPLCVRTVSLLRERGRQDAVPPSQKVANEGGGERAGGEALWPPVPRTNYPPASSHPPLSLQVEKDQPRSNVHLPVWKELGTEKSLFPNSTPSPAPGWSSPKTQIIESLLCCPPLPCKNPRNRLPKDI